MTANPLLKEDLNKKTTSSSLYPSIEPHLFSPIVKKMRLFFEERGFLEVHTQNRLSILAACEDPKTVTTYNYVGKVWPLPQTGQMWLEQELLNNPDASGFFCLSTSYRNKPNPVEGRHALIFPTFEFAMHGGINDMIQLEAELLEFLGFGEVSSFPNENYLDVAGKYGVVELEEEEEDVIGKERGAVFFLRNFPEYTNPLWNMKRDEKNSLMSNQVNVLLHGMDTIRSAERGCDKELMRKSFFNIEQGTYAQRLFHLFGKERVINELEDFLSLNFFPRSTGSIDMTRMIGAMQLSNLV
ncbi:MAG: hypothetical protein MK212_08105 [Saprospiraceae bacterium]|nr:hypothetical protein [Saprospiraceae bacterium]